MPTQKRFVCLNEAKDDNNRTILGMTRAIGPAPSSIYEAKDCSPGTVSNYTVDSSQDTITERDSELSGSDESNDEMTCSSSASPNPLYETSTDVKKFSEEDGGNSSEVITHAFQFPHIVHAMVTETSRTQSNVVTWIEDGEAFVVNDTSNALSTVLQKFFQHTKYTSLQRQLNMYGWKKCVAGKYKGAFYHPQFHRDKGSMHELSQIKRKASPRRAIGKGGHPEQTTKRRNRLSKGSKAKTSFPSNLSAKKSAKTKKPAKQKRSVKPFRDRLKDRCATPDEDSKAHEVSKNEPCPFTPTNTRVDVLPNSVSTQSTLPAPPTDTWSPFNNIDDFSEEETGGVPKLPHTPVPRSFRVLTLPGKNNPDDTATAAALALSTMFKGSRPVFI